MKPRFLKQTAMLTAGMLGVDRFFRHINRKKLLVVMYHGITTTPYTLPIWTQLPLETFRIQLKFLRSHYQPVSLSDVIAAISGEKGLPERAVLVTFDDGLRNNFTCAFPLLKELDMPAAIFLTVNLIGTTELLWFDELLFLLQGARTYGIHPKLDNQEAENLLHKSELWRAYQLVVDDLKHAGTEQRARIICRLRANIPLNHTQLQEDFGLLTWDEVHTMHQSGMIEFGVHTATHRILTELADDEWKQEIVTPRKILENKLQREITAFCFPNGRPGIDFTTDHLAGLKTAGYSCSFTTQNALFDCSTGDSMSISRVPAGNDDTSDPACFSLNTSGALQFMKAVTGA